MKAFLSLILLVFLGSCKTNTLYSYHMVSTGFGSIEMWAPSRPDEEGHLQWPKVNIEPNSGYVIKDVKVSFWHDTVMEDGKPQQGEVQVTRMINMMESDGMHLESRPMHLPEGIDAYGAWQYRVEVDFGDGLYVGKTIPVTFTD